MPYGNLSKMTVHGNETETGKNQHHLVGLGGHGALGNAQKECHDQQGALYSPATLRE